MATSYAPWKRYLVRKGVSGTLARASMASVLVTGAASLLAVLLSVVLARILGPHEFGVYAYVLAVISLMAIPARVGLPNLVVRQTAKYQVSGDWALMRGLWIWSSLLVAIMSVVLILGTAAVGGFSWRQSGESYGRVMLWGIALVPLLSLGALRGAALRGLQRTVLGQLPDLVLRPALLVAFAVVASLLWINDEASAVRTMQLHLLAAGISFGIGTFMLLRARPGELRDVTTFRFATSAWLKSVGPLMFMAGVFLINRQTDILILGIYAEPADVGVYRVVTQGAILVSLGLQAINHVVAPYFARLHEQGNFRNLQIAVSLGARAALLLAVPVVLLYVTIGGTLLRVIFGPGFETGQTALAILAIGQLTNAAMGSVGFLLNMTGNERRAARGVAIAAVLNIVLNFWLIPPFGLNGAATATAASIVVWNLLLWEGAYQTLGINTFAFARARRTKGS